jgi:DNA-binding response OmpR family regulator
MDQGADKEGREGTRDAAAIRHVLVVEDEQYFATMLATFLELDGFTVLGPAPSVIEALSLIDAAPKIDCAVLDIDLNGEASYPVADALVGRRIPFLFLTGFDREVVPEKYARFDMRQKPVEALQLSRSLNDLLRQRERSSSSA